MLKLNKKVTVHLLNGVAEVHPRAARVAPSIGIAELSAVPHDNPSLGVDPVLFPEVFLLKESVINKGACTTRTQGFELDK